MFSLCSPVPEQEAEEEPQQEVEAPEQEVEAPAQEVEDEPEVVPPVRCYQLSIRGRVCQ